MSRMVKIIFTLSLFLNIAGLSAAGVYMVRNAGDDRGEVRLSDDARKELREKFMASKEDMLPALRSMKQKTDTLSNVITQKDFDIDAYQVAVDAVLDVRDDISRKKAQKMGQTLQNLSLEERQKLSKYLVRGLSQERGHRGHRTREQDSFKERRERYRQQ